MRVPVPTSRRRKVIAISASRCRAWTFRAKVSGGAAYVHDMRLPGMVHARVVRPPSYGARLQEIDSAKVEQMPGVVKVVRDGSFLAVVAEREFQAISAMTALAAAAKWQGSRILAGTDATSSHTCCSNPRRPARLSGAAPSGRMRSALSKRLSAATIRCMLRSVPRARSAVERRRRDRPHAKQGVFPLRGAIAEDARRPWKRVRCIHTEGSGCYGHNGADDVAADAALIAAALPGRPVACNGCASTSTPGSPTAPRWFRTRGRRSSGRPRIVEWQYEVWSNSHKHSPARHAGHLTPRRISRSRFSRRHRNSIPFPTGAAIATPFRSTPCPTRGVVHHFIPAMPLRVSALRGLGAYVNVFAIESFMDELAVLAGADPVDFRLRHLDDARARAVVEAAAEKFGWARRSRTRRARPRLRLRALQESRAYVAVAVEVERRARNRAHPTGARRCSDRLRPGRQSRRHPQPDRRRHRPVVELDAVRAVAFDRNRITSRDWSTYPILRFSTAPHTSMCT